MSTEALRVGAVVTGLTFLDAEGRTVPVERFRGRPLLLVFLRHLG